MLNLISVDPEKEKTEILVIPVCEDKDIHDNKIILNFVKQAKKIKEFKGEKDDEAIFYHQAGTRAARLIFLGLGKLEKLNLEMLRVMSGKAVKKCIKKNLSEMLFAVPCAGKINIKTGSILEAMMEGAFLGNYMFDKYKNKKKHKPLKKIDFLVEPDDVEKFGDLSLRTEAVCKGTMLAREWVNTPSNDKRPEEFTESIKILAEKEALKVNIMDDKELKKEKFGALLSVAAGSSSKPRMILLEYSPKTAKKTIVLVGKGVTFDSGGINLKPADSLEDMKMDMSGAAAVAATLITAAIIKPDVKIIGAIPVVENMPSGDASRPGDIIKSYDGKTVEIGNTDAEGRLILIDAISYVIKKYNPDTLIDMATLTGACVIALGEKIAGVFSYDDELADAIVDSGKKTNERCWRMPLPDDYKDLLKSDFADIKNISSSRWGGAITAALFLAEFVKNTRWAHIDIAGPAYLKKENAYCTAGGTGFGVRLFCDLIDKL